MAKKLTYIIAVIAVVLFAGSVRVYAAEIINGSFEEDGQIEDITADEPNGWTDVNVPDGKFLGWVYDDWATDGDYSLTLYSYDYGTFSAGDMATISQQVYLTEDINEIIFDLYLDTAWNEPWDPNERSAVLLIDDNQVWESNSVGSDIRGEYLDQVYVIDGAYKDANSHKLSLGLKAKTGGVPLIEYYAQWDSVGFTYSGCDGLGFLPTDFSRDCYVDFTDFAMFADYWLQVVTDPNDKYDLAGDDSVVDTNDLGAFSGSWLKSSYD